MLYTFLIVLCVLSLMSMSSAVFTGLSSYFTGPMSADKLEMAEAELAKSVTGMKNMGQDGFAHMMQVIIDKMHYSNEKVFMLQNTLTLLVALLDIGAVVLMLKLRKLGFHLYIIYCLASVGITYIIFPLNLILPIEIYFSLIISALFCFLYSRNLKTMH